MQTGKAQLPCGSVGTVPAPRICFTQSDHPALPITRFTISQSAQWKRGPMNSNHYQKIYKKRGGEGKGKIATGMAFYLSWKYIYILLNVNSAWDSGGESSRCRKFLSCFLFTHFSKHPFYFQWAFKRVQEDSHSGIKRERILELQSLANPFSVKLCVFLCAVMKRWEKRTVPTLSTTRPAKRTSDSRSRAYPLLAQSPRIFTARWYSQRTLSSQQLSRIWGSEAAMGKVSNSTFTHLRCHQIRKSILAVFSLHKGNSAGKEAHLPEPMKKSSNSFLSYNRPEFISPNILQGLVFQVTVGFQSSTHITYSNQRECSKAQISSLQVSFPNCVQIDFSKTHTHIFDKHIYSCY